MGTDIMQITSHFSKIAGNRLRNSKNEHYDTNDVYDFFLNGIICEWPIIIYSFGNDNCIHIEFRSKNILDT